jgi:hypothetical protein
MRASLSKVAKVTVVSGLLLLAAGCGGGGGGGDTGGSGGGVSTGGTGGHGTGGTGTGGSGTGGSGTGGNASGGAAGHANGGSSGNAGATGLAGTGGGGAGATGSGGAAGASAGTGGAAGASGGAGGAAGAPGSGGAAGGSAAGASGTGGAAGSSASGTAGQGGTAGGSAAGASGSAGAAGTSGSAGSNGAAGAAGGAAAGTSGSAGSSGAAGAGGAAGSGPAATLIQNVQDGTIATGSVVSLPNVFVTAVLVSSSNNTTLYVQEPEGVTTTGHTYPQYAGVEVFVTNNEAGGLPALATITEGDCISLVGTTSEFNSAATEIITLTALSRVANAASCGTFPTPLAVPSTLASFADLATDTSSTTAGDQTGAKAETFEDVLVTFSNVQVVSRTATQFRVSTNAAAAQTLLVDPFLYSFTLPSLATTYTHVLGIYTQFGTAGNPSTFRLQPRSAADLVP